MDHHFHLFRSLYPSMFLGYINGNGKYEFYRVAIASKVNNGLRTKHYASNLIDEIILSAYPSFEKSFSFFLFLS